MASLRRSEVVLLIPNFCFSYSTLALTHRLREMTFRPSVSQPLDFDFWRACSLSFMWFTSERLRKDLRNDLQCFFKPYLPPAKNQFKNCK